MSRYDELCDSSEVALRNYYDHRDRVDSFLRKRFLPGLSRFLESPEGKLWTFDFSSPGMEQQPLSKAMQPDEECYWRLGLGIRMERPSFFSEIGYLLRCRGIEKQFTVEVADKSFIMISDADLEACYAHIFWHIKHYNEQGLIETLRTDLPRKFGFLP